MLWVDFSNLKIQPHFDPIDLNTTQLDNLRLVEIGFDQHGSLVDIIVKIDISTGSSTNFSLPMVIEIKINGVTEDTIQTNFTQLASGNATTRCWFTSCPCGPPKKCGKATLGHFELPGDCICKIIPWFGDYCLCQYIGNMSSNNHIIHPGSNVSVILDINNDIPEYNETDNTLNVIYQVPAITVNAPELVKSGEDFEASIDVDSITDFNAGQFDLSFDANIVNVTEVANGSIDGETIPVDKWERMDEDTIRVFLAVSGIAGVNGPGNLATISFAVVGMGGDRSVLDISEGLLGNAEAEEIPAVWVDDEVIVGPVKVVVNAPEFVAVGGTFTATIDVADDVANFNMALFDLSFDSSVLNVTDVAEGSLDGTTIPVTSWAFIDSNTIRVMSELSGDTGVSGSGNLATISFEVVGKGGDRSVLDITNGMLANNEVKEIPAVWVDDEVIVGPANVVVNAPEFVAVGGTFTATVDVADDVANFNMALFDLSFDSNVVNVTDVAEGSLDGTTIPVTSWAFIDSNTIRVMSELFGAAGVSGSGNLATISFAVVGKGGDRSVLDITDGMLGNTEAEEIPAVWVDDEVIVGPVNVVVNAPEFVAVGGTFTATIDVADDVANFNMALFDLSFDSNVVNVTDVAGGSLDGTAIPVTSWAFIDSNTIRVMCELSGATGVSGSGNLATISFEVVGKGGDRSVLDISDGMLANNEAEEIPAEWIDDEITLR